MHSYVVTRGLGIILENLGGGVGRPSWSPYTKISDFPDPISDLNYISGILYSGIHISSRQVVRDDYKVLRTSIKTHKLVRWTSKF